ncbi:MAG: hypothetical protein K2I66_04985 [Bacteroidales bacterium]|nr:hypothetical protein [Bacteroidales bacterium]
MKRIATILLFLTVGTHLYPQTGADSLFFILPQNLKEVSISGHRIKSLVENEGTQMRINIQEISKLPRFMGQSDPLRYLHTIAGVQTNNESTAGIYIQGCDDSQTLLDLNGAPVYYPNHLLGIFSGFIPAHLQDMKVVKLAHDAAFGNRLGGEVSLQTVSDLPGGKKVSLDANIGLICSDATVGIACGRKSELFLSARASYINLLYGKWLSIDGFEPRYGFQDANLTYAVHPTDKDDVVLTTYFGNDRLRLGMDSTTLSAQIQWQNSASSVYWNRKLDSGNMRTTLFASGFRNQFSVYREISVEGFSDIGSLGVKHLQTRRLGSKMELDFGGGYSGHRLTPLWFRSEGWSSHVPKETSFVHEAELFADLKHQINAVFSYSVGLHGSVFANEGKVFGSLDPRFNLHIDINKNHTINTHIGIYTQYLHRIALVDGGFPIDFWMPAGERFKPEYAHSAGLGYIGHFLDDNLVLTAEVYYKQLFHVIENGTNIVQLVTHDFEYIDGIASGKGRNYGLDIMLQKNKGKVRGYVSYSLGWAQRHITAISDKWFSAGHERRHNLVLVVNYRINDSWNIGGTFTLASGTPYTAPKYIYLINGQIVAEYGDFNGDNLPLTHRLDLSCDYTILRKKGVEFGVNLSLYNVYAHKNVQFVRISHSQFETVPVSLLGTIIPSLSLYLKM